MEANEDRISKIVGVYNCLYGSENLSNEEKVLRMAEYYTNHFLHFYLSPKILESESAK